ncbi:PREDICTED: uncharacterized protein LOC109466967 isoform X1 [Branchiostoma belcheri]|uniref:Uncharacterized protein LOC109466967 isoform X1 n=2 Tax=Branchiostoma belcheri TaxID=7741 RepID=A0A6P4YT08_BRABE|nr:PREDICTED: uncharacterized protein LOC109466967 isoform X1 [Branchiostoma belcheri]
MSKNMKNGHLAYNVPDNANLILNTSTDSTLECPSYEALRRDRRRRTRESMQAVDSRLAASVIPKVDNLTREERAAITLQKHFRGHLARKEYINLLWAQFDQEEAKRLKKALKQVEEGELLVENHHLSVQYEDNASIRKNRSRFYKWRIVTIQRAWRAYKRRKELGKRRDLSDDLLAADDLFTPYGPVPTSDPSDTDSLAAMSVGSNTDLSKDDGIESEGESLPISVEDFPEADQKISPGSDIIADYEDEEEEEEYYQLYQNAPPPTRHREQPQLRRGTEPAEPAQLCRHVRHKTEQEPNLD